MKAAGVLVAIVALLGAVVFCAAAMAAGVACMGAYVALRGLARLLAAIGRGIQRGCL